MITEETLRAHEGRSPRDIAEHIAEIATLLAESVRDLDDNADDGTENDIRVNVGCFIDEVASEIVYLATRVRAGRLEGYEFLPPLADAVRRMEVWRLTRAH